MLPKRLVGWEENFSWYFNLSNSCMWNSSGMNFMFLIGIIWCESETRRSIEWEREMRDASRTGYWVWILELTVWFPFALIKRHVKIILWQKRRQKKWKTVERGNWKSIYLSINVESMSVTLVDIWSMLLFPLSDWMLIESPFFETRAYELISIASQTLKTNTELSSKIAERVNNFTILDLLARSRKYLMNYYEFLMSQLHSVFVPFSHQHARKRVFNFTSFLRSSRDHSNDNDENDELMPFFSFPWNLIQYHSFVNIKSNMNLTDDLGPVWIFHFVLFPW